ncbi:MAG: FAD-dependent oxidoreductase [Proteobacteria bacterium]|nr:FAD-dependent oxidoreductase [Pseudomonadota bacterium]
MANDKIGAVMIIGGGIGGMQSALDLADSGYLVYLVEKNSAIGGRMAQLDKTFPTNDCSMCIMGPKLVECGRHLNIEILTMTEVVEVTGEPGHFQAKLLERPRYVDMAKCTACGECEKACPISIPSLFDQGLCDRKAAYKLYPQAMPGAFAIEKRGTAPCKATCPAHVSVQGYIALINQGKYQEALALFKEAHPFPAICGRVCHHPCEEICTRGDVEEPIAIQYLHRFLADLDLASETRYVPEVKERRDEKVAIIGSGPAGLTAAYYLTIEGYQVTVFEKLPVAGGMTVVGIPEYRLPRDIIAAEIQVIQDMGVEIKTEVTFGEDITLESLKKDGFQALFLATGLHLSMKLNVEGEDLPGVVKGIEFLRDVALGNQVSVGKRVIVIGGGNVAIDVALTAKRVGAQEITLVCLERREEMPAWEYEIEEALEEGVTIVNSLGPNRFLKEDGNLSGIEFKCCTCVFDENGVFCPEYDETDLSGMEADTVIVAIGQAADLSFAEKEGIAVKRGPVADPITLQTPIEWVFAGGDAFYGPKSVVEAVACGKDVAESIDRYLNGRDLKEGREQDWSYEKPDTEGELHLSRTPMRKISVEEREGNFKEIALGFTEKEARDEAQRCMKCGICSECYQCVSACLAGAIDHSMIPREHTIEVGSIVVAPGFSPFDPSQHDTYGYSEHPNVVTSLEFERMLSASGPFKGHLVTLSADHKEPEKIAWIQCVGSRNTQVGDKGYCSAVCCTYAIKQAMIAKEHSPGPLNTAIFYIDIRTYGKDFERYYNRAKDEIGIRFVKAKINNVLPGDEPGGLKIRYTDDGGRLVQEDFDIVVLSVGIDISQESLDLAQKLGVDLDHYNFVDTTSFEPVTTSRPGVYACGVFEAPKDIPDTVTQASAAAASATSELAEVRGALVKKKEYPPERDVSNEPIRIGAFICHCGINIGGVADVPAIVEYAKTLPHVDYAEANLFTCSEDTQAKMKEVIVERQLNRVVVASCTPRTHEGLFRETCREAGLNQYLFEMANIRDQCTWVHMGEPEKATEKAKDLVRMAIARAATLEQLYEIPQPVCQEALVVGGGVAGMTAAFGLAKQGFKTCLVEKEDRLGGQALRLRTTWKNERVEPYVEELIQRVSDHPLIDVRLQTKIKEVHGTIGSFQSKLADAEGTETEVSYGAAIIANGGDSYEPEEYLYGEDPNILLSLDLDQEIMQNPDRFKKVDSAIFIQCVGSREPDRPYCSKVCCTHSIQSALTLKELNPGMNIYILYRDIRTYGEREDLYREARLKGVRFIRYELDDKPLVEKKDGRLRVTVIDQVIKRPVVIDTDMVTLASAIVPRDDNGAFAQLFKVAMNQDGFFMEAHAKLRPVDFASGGLFVCGLAHGPKAIDEAISQAEATVSRACMILSHKERMAGGAVAEVNPDLCAICLTCVRVCPFGVPQIDFENAVAKIDPGACQGCGICASMCPNDAIQVKHYEDIQMIPKLMAIY